MYIDQLKGWQPELEAQKADVEEQLGALKCTLGCPQYTTGVISLILQDRGFLLEFYTVINYDDQ